MVIWGWFKMKSDRKGYWFWSVSMVISFFDFDGTKLPASMVGIKRAFANGGV